MIRPAKGRGHAVFWPIDFQVMRRTPSPECSICSPFERIVPAIVEYSSGKPDGLMGASAIKLAPKEIGLELAARFKGIELRPVKFHTGVSTFSEPGKEFPASEYFGPELVELWFPHIVPYNPDQSHLLIEEKCQTCGRISALVEGVELGIGPWPDPFIRNRAPDKGIRIPAAALEGNDVFRYATLRFMVLEDFKQFVEERGYPNFDFIDFGEIV